MSTPDTGPSDPFVDQVRRARIIPVLRTRTPGAAVAAAGRCFDGGLSVVELTTTTPGWQEALARVRQAHHGRTVGVGTVLSVEHARQAMEAGADFLVSPCPVPAVRDHVAGRLPLMEGGMTVAEILSAASRGIAKLFPAHVGGTKYLRSLLAIAPGSRIVPTGGIPLRHVADWLDAGALAVGVGSDLLAEDDVTVAIRDALRS